MVFVRNTSSQLTLEEQKLKLLIIITECEVEVDRIDRRIKKNNNQSVLDSKRERY